MDVFEAIRTRRSVRSFEDSPVARELIEQVIEGGRWAPSACNIQGARFVVVEDAKEKKVLIEAGVTKLKNTPVGIFVLYDNRTHNQEYADHIQSGAAAIQNMMLSAHALGLGAVWICNLPSQQKMRKLLQVPWYLAVIGLVRLGHPKQIPGPVPRKKTLAEVCTTGINLSLKQKASRQSQAAWQVKTLLSVLYTIGIVNKTVLSLSRFFPVTFREKVKKYISRKHE